MLGGLFGGALTFYILFLVITAGCVWELTGLLHGASNHNYLIRRIGGTVIGTLPFLFTGVVVLIDDFPGWMGSLGGWITGDGALVLLLVGILLLVFSLFILELFLQSERPFTALGYHVLGVAYIGLPFSLLILIGEWDGQYTPNRILGLLLLNWANDTFAYLIGSVIGKRPFFARISPKKTWEGTLGGIVCTMAGAYLLFRLMPVFTLPEWMALAACVSVFGTLGDLVESMLKRSVQVKDSGTILPGHGGFLDRFDSFIFMLPFAWMALALLNL